jgi:hypothetical protein
MFERTFLNKEPVGDDLTVLDLLFSDRWNYRVERRLKGHYTARPIPYVELYAYSYEYISVTQSVVSKLKMMGWVDGKKHWGYTDNNDLNISEAGVLYMYKVWTEVGVPSGHYWDRRLRADDWIRKTGDGAWTSICAEQKRRVAEFQAAEKVTSPLEDTPSGSNVDS